MVFSYSAWRGEHPLPLALKYPLFKVVSWRMKKKYPSFNPDEHTFEYIAIQTQTECNYDCSFCPNNKIERPHGTMKKRLFKKIIEDLADMNYTGTVFLHLMNEPFIDKRMVDFIDIARSRIRSKIIIFTNGSLLTEELIKRIPEDVKILLNDYTGGKIIERVKVMNAGLNFIFRVRSDNEYLSNRAGNVFSPTKSPYKLFCVRPFRNIYVGFDGRVPLCCQDWKFEEVMGNARKQSLQEIWSGNEYEKKRKELLKSERNGLCAKCDWRGFTEWVL